MSAVILSKMYAEPPVCEKEILRYAGCREADDDTVALLRTCLDEVRDKLTYKVCYRILPVSTDGDVCDFGTFAVRSKQLAGNLAGCRQAVLFAATIGMEADRLIAKYGRLSPAKALLCQAIGAERIEALCDAFCTELAAETGGGLRPRFSPGYGDLPLAAQKDIFAVLECEKRIGLTLNDSLLMSPSKSVTAFAGLSESQKIQARSKCGACTMRDCTFRGAL